MRTGGCTVQQTLTPEAASVVKQAMALARRRGHAQVTPLHVANTMLASPTGLLRRACLQSHSHPLQCKALELCFNVALNRLPASSSSPMFGPQSQNPSISNALVAAFKRAQAHQRRGSIENQQQPILAVKIELEQLIISILDDPSVSRVMREAGFSSIQVKSNVEQAVSLELCSPSNPKENNTNNNSLFLSQSSSSSPSTTRAKHEDVMSVVDTLMNRRRRSIVVVGECLPSLEAVIKGVREKVDNGDVGEPLKEVKFISVPLSAFGNNRREEVDQKIGELTCLVKSLVSKGVVLYLGDLKWITDYRANNSSSSGSGRIGYYCSVEHMIMEIGRLMCSFGEHGMVWLVGIATFQTFMRCKTGHHSLESVWGLHPTTVPAGSLGLSLNPAESDSQAEHRNKKSENGSSWMILENGDNEEKQLNCCADCSAKFEVEALSLQKNSSMNESALSSLPPWLRDESRRLHSSTHDQNCVSVKELCKKWNSICSSEHKQQNKSLLERNLTFPPPSSSSSFFSYDQQQQYPSLRMYIPENTNPRTAFWSNPNSTPTTASSSEIMENEYVPKFKQLSAENLNILCNALEEKVPWQKDIIAEIAGTILQCRSGMVRRREKSRNGGDEVKEETWLFFKGGDVQAKEKIARELAKVVFGSHSKLVSIALSSFSSTSSTEDFRNKRTRDEQSCSYIERFSQAVLSNPHRVFMVEDVEQVDYCSQVGLKRAIERGKIGTFNGEEVSFGDAIIILSCESFSSRSRACSPPVKQKSSSENALSDDNKEEGGEETTSSCGFLDLNISINDDHDSFVEDDQCAADGVDNLGLLESVDRCVTFKIQNHEEDIIFV